jgi:acetyl esterase/lipase
LIFPSLDDRNMYGSADAITDTRVWNRSLREWSWRSYLRSVTHDVPAYAAPMRLGSFAGLPPAYVLVAALDPLRDEAIAFAQRLLSAGVACELVVLPGVFHGFDAFAPDSDLAKRAHSQTLLALKQAVQAAE